MPYNSKRRRSSAETVIQQPSNPYATDTNILQCLSVDVSNQYYHILNKPEYIQFIHKKAELRRKSTTRSTPLGKIKFKVQQTPFSDAPSKTRYMWHGSINQYGAKIGFGKLDNKRTNLSVYCTYGPRDSPATEILTDELVDQAFDSAAYNGRLTAYIDNDDTRIRGYYKASGTTETNINCIEGEWNDDVLVRGKITFKNNTVQIGEFIDDPNTNHLTMLGHCVQVYSNGDMDYLLYNKLTGTINTEYTQHKLYFSENSTEWIGSKPVLYIGPVCVDDNRPYMTVNGTMYFKHTDSNNNIAQFTITQCHKNSNVPISGIIHYIDGTVTNDVKVAVINGAIQIVDTSSGANHNDISDALLMPALPQAPSTQHNAITHHDIQDAAMNNADQNNTNTANDDNNMNHTDIDRKVDFNDKPLTQMRHSDIIEWISHIEGITKDTITKFMNARKFDGIFFATWTVEHFKQDILNTIDMFDRDNILSHKNHKVECDRQANTITV